MYIDPIRPAPVSVAAERAGKRVVAALQEMAGGCAELLAMEERPWASATFSGARHTITLRFHGSADCETADGFIETLPEHEFTLAGLLVADAQVRAVTYENRPEPVMTVEAELLLLNED
ncbi:hypothetical protein [Pseudoblastomonas halimionae]|nr:hypothetical protein [Alteriqipengyuania halimionae]